MAFVAIVDVANLYMEIDRMRNSCFAVLLHFFLSLAILFQSASDFERRDFTDFMAFCLLFARRPFDGICSMFV